MRFLRGFVIAFLIITLVAVPVIAAYSVNVTVRETGGAAYRMLPYSVPFNTVSLISQGYTTTATGLDVFSSSGPIMLTNTTLFSMVTTLPANSTSTSTITTGNTPASAFAIICGYGGNFTVADDAAMSSNDPVSWEDEISLYIDASNATSILSRPNSAIDVISNGTIQYTAASFSFNLQAPVTTGNHTIKINCDNVTGTKLYIDGVLKNSTATNTRPPLSAGVWVAMGGNGNKYWNYWKHTVNGTLIAHYEPVTYILGANLPDRAGTPQNGTFSFGANPANVTVSMGTLRSTAAIGVNSNGNPEVPGVIPTVTVPGMTASEAGLQGTDIFPYELIKAISDITTYPVTVLWAIWAFAWALVFALIVFIVTRGHFFFTGIVGSVPLIFYTVVEVLPYYVLIFVVIGVVGGGLLDRERY
jgi:hypothetical protein